MSQDPSRLIMRAEPGLASVGGLVGLAVGVSLVIPVVSADVGGSSVEGGMMLLFLGFAPIAAALPEPLVLSYAGPLCWACAGLSAGLQKRAFSRFLFPLMAVVHCASAVVFAAKCGPVDWAAIGALWSASKKVIVVYVLVYTVGQILLWFIYLFPRYVSILRINNQCATSVFASGVVCLFVTCFATLCGARTNMPLRIISAPLSLIYSGTDIGVLLIWPLLTWTTVGFLSKAPWIRLRRYGFPTVAIVHYAAAAWTCLGMDANGETFVRIWQRERGYVLYIWMFSYLIMNMVIWCLYLKSSQTIPCGAPTAHDGPDCS